MLNLVFETMFIKTLTLRVCLDYGFGNEGMSLGMIKVNRFTCMYFKFRIETLKIRVSPNPSYLMGLENSFSFIYTSKPLVISKFKPNTS